jgi:hypothetical protein
MVDHRTARLIHRSYKLLVHLERRRAEAKTKSQDDWLQLAKERAARIVSRAETDSQKGPIAASSPGDA